MRIFRNCRWLPLALLAFGLALQAGEPKKPTQEEREALEAAEEDRLVEGKKAETGHEFNARGKLILAPTEEGKTPAVLGIFTADGKTYQVKVAHEELRARLRPYHNKDVGLGGRIRNSGKNLIVEDILEGSGTPAATLRNPRGL